MDLSLVALDQYVSLSPVKIGRTSTRNPSLLRVFKVKLVSRRLIRVRVTLNSQGSNLLPGGGVLRR